MTWMAKLLLYADWIVMYLINRHLLLVMKTFVLYRYDVMSQTLVFCIFFVILYDLSRSRN